MDDIDELVRRASRTCSNFASLEEAAKVLTPYATSLRYPGGSYEAMPTREEFDVALNHAQTVLDFVIKQLPPETNP